MNAPSYDTDLLVVGAGPAGVAAAVMAASLDMRSIVVEAERVGEKLHRIDALENVPGAWSTGPQLADALSQDLGRLQQVGRCTVVKARCTAVAGHKDHAELELNDGRKLTGRAVIIATGVTELIPADVSWISAPNEFSPAPLWRSTPGSLAGRTYVLGGDRPLGTWLRAHLEVHKQLYVLCPPSDDYKTAEIVHDERVHLVPVSHIAIETPSYGSAWTVRVKDRRGSEKAYSIDTLVNNLGTKPAAIPGTHQDQDGYCPTHLQHPRVLTAGDIRSGRFQRIITSQGSGAEAALSLYYDRALPRS
ncbi:FAD-dependent oxidoreductase [Streptomyces sp. NPDC039022]|uniref:FAD-dependent oxidoreductase n=1 Tax=unclassified Streptomyces TaxID=2593676 RepID=UPI0033D6B936